MLALTAGAEEDILSRSNPSENGTPNPAARWFEWNGENGTVRYYDKEAKQKVEVGSDFTFLLLDQLGSVGGWHKSSDSGIYSNEVKDTRQDALIVKSFKGGTLAEGIYADIKDKVKSQGGQFVANCYIAFKNGGGKLAIGSLKMKGAALRAWMEFGKEYKGDMYSKAIRINGFTEGKTGKVVFRMPVFSVKDTTVETHTAATALDQSLQTFLSGYFKRTKRDQVEEPHHVSDQDMDSDNYDNEMEAPSLPTLTDDDIPF